jgi:hypothetical protein
MVWCFFSQNKTTILGGTEQGAESGQLVALPNEFLDREVDNIREILADSGNIHTRLHHLPAGSSIMRGNAQPGANQVEMPEADGAGVILGQSVRSVRVAGGVRNASNPLASLLL